MSDFYEQAVTQLMRTGRVGLRDEENGNLYVSTQRNGTYKILVWYDDDDGEHEHFTNLYGALEQIHSWCANLEKLSSL